MSPHAPRSATGRAVRTTALLLAVLLPHATPAAQDVPSEEWSAPGITEPFLDVTLGTPSAGIVANRPVEEGDHVTKDSVVLELQNRLEELALEQRRIAEEIARQDFESTRELYDRTRSISLDEVRRKEADFQVAKTETGIAAERLRQRRLEAPFDGQVVEIFLDVGEAARLNEPLVRLVDTRTGFLVCDVDAVRGHSLRLEQPVQVQLQAGESLVVRDAVIAFISPVADPASGLVKVKARFDNTRSPIRLGTTGRLLVNGRTGS